MKKSLAIVTTLLVFLAACASPKLTQYGPVTIYTTPT